MDKLDLICKFVYLRNKEIGETIDIYDEKLIVKMGADFAAIPMENIERIDGERIYISAYNEKQAFETGQKWVDEKSKPVSIEELKIFGFGEESKNRFSVILKEIGECEDEGKGEDEDENKDAKVRDEQGKVKGDASKDIAQENDSGVKENDGESRDKKLGEGIIDKL